MQNKPISPKGGMPRRSLLLRALGAVEGPPVQFTEQPRIQTGQAPLGSPAEGLQGALLV